MSRVAKASLRDLGTMLLVPGLLALPAALVAWLAGESYALPGLGLTALLSFGVGGGLTFAFWRYRNERSAPSQPVMALAWLLNVLLAALPFYFVTLAKAPLSPTTLAFRDPVNALFEAMSGLTGTGLTVATDASTLPHTLQWWRSSLEWVGGIGVMFLALAIIEPGEDDEAEHGSEMGAELSTQRLSNETQGVVRAVWMVYLGYTGVAVGAFWAAGMPLWAALNHGMTGVATGGFTITGDSFQGYGVAVKLVGVVVMLAGAVSFAVHYALVARRRLGLLVRDVQNAALGSLLGLGTLALFLITLRDRLGFTDVLFQWTSALATCGFSTVNPSAWSAPALLLLTGAMFVGGASGSTAGGLKQRRVALLAKSLVWRLRSAADEKQVYTFDGDEMDEAEAFRRVHGVATLLVLFLLSLGTGTLLLLLTLGGRFGLSATLFEAASALGTTGLTSGVTGPDLPADARLVLITLMWLGRLEVLAVLVLLAKPGLLYRSGAART